jgi:hypothetical protein
VFGALVKTGAAAAGVVGTDVGGVEVVGLLLLPLQAVSRKTINEADKTRYRDKMYSPGQNVLHLMQAKGHCLFQSVVQLI